MTRRYTRITRVHARARTHTHNTQHRHVHLDTYRTFTLLSTCTWNVAIPAVSSTTIDGIPSFKMAHEGQHPPALENGLSRRAAGLLLAQSQAKAACWRHNRKFLTETGFLRASTMVQSPSSRLTSERRQSDDSQTLSLGPVGWWPISSTLEIIYSLEISRCYLLARIIFPVMLWLP